MFKQLNGEKLIVGYDLGDTCSQISYYIGDGVETLSLVAGAENYNIPTVLCKRSGVNQWFYGKEAIRYSEENQGVLIENLLSMAVDGEEVQIEGTGFDPVALLTLFFKRSLGMLSQIAPLYRLTALMITCEKLDYRVAEVLSSVVAAIKLKTDKVMFQSHAESFYYYMIQQPEELWLAKSLLFEYGTGVFPPPLWQERRTDHRCYYAPAPDRRYGYPVHCLLRHPLYHAGHQL